MESQATSKISVVIPAYNEAERIDKTLRIVKKSLGDSHTAEYVLGSTLRIISHADSA
jgi:cellulose synthase/poly-beta-1,6-N-acetylglucosamine synthase-like glycosyltransferase